MRIPLLELSDPQAGDEKAAVHLRPHPPLALPLVARMESLPGVPDGCPGEGSGWRLGQMVEGGAIKLHLLFS